MKKLLPTVFAFVLASVFSLSAQAQELKGSAVAGAKKNAMCIGCHGTVGYKTGFPEVHRVPMISGQGSKYIVAALKEYKSGERKHPSMRGIAESLTDQDMLDLASYFEANGAGVKNPSEEHGKVYVAQAQALVTKAGCPACHGVNFSKPSDPAYPKLAGQHGDYLYVALRAYKNNEKSLIGRGNPIMAGMVKQFSDAELQTLAQYIESLPGDLVTVQRGRFR